MWKAALLTGVLLCDAAPKWDTERWVGAEYTPWKASNELWWHTYQDYRSDVVRELKLTKEIMGFTSIRVFLHTMLYDDDAEKLKANMADFLDITEEQGFSVGFAFFDDCWSHSGANLTAPCVAKKGLHNGCWMASPQDVDRTNVERFEPYVSDIVKTFATDKRIAWWEIYNEPQRKNEFTMSLRHAAFGWAKAQNPSQPVLACWDDSEDTEIVDSHQYSNPWGVDAKVFTNPAKGGIVTEAGARWYQKTDSDAGSPLTVLNWLTALRGEGELMRSWDRSGDDMDEIAALTVEECESRCRALDGCVTFIYADESCSDTGSSRCWLKSKVGEGREAQCRDSKVVGGQLTPFIPGVMIDWEVMVGHSQTRWHWGDAEGIAEPPIPWHNHIFPDGTPVSFTEAAATRRYMTGIDEFLFLDTFLDVSDPRSKEMFLTLKPGEDYGGLNGTVTEGLFELTLWPESAFGDSVAVLVGSGYMVTIGPVDSATTLTLTGPNGILGSHNLDSGLPEGGVVQASWNMLRILVEDERIRVWFNPQFSDVTGASVPPEDEKTLTAMPARIDVAIPAGGAVRGGGGGVQIAAASTNAGAIRVDYVSVLPPKLYGLASESALLV